VEIKHNVGSQKLQGTARYTVDKSAEVKLLEELRLGYVRINEWLKKMSYPRLTIPNICGYAPLVSYLANQVKDTTLETSVTY
jgi:hypothetical protein